MSAQQTDAALKYASDEIDRLRAILAPILDSDDLLDGSPDVYWGGILKEIEGSIEKPRHVLLFNHQAAHLLAWATIARDAAKALKK